MWNFLLNALALTRKEKPIIIHAHWWLPAGIIGVIVAKILRCPLVISIHGTDLRLLNHFRLLRTIARIVLRQAEQITTTTLFLKTKIVTLLNIPADKIKIIPMPIELPTVTHCPPKIRHQIITIARLSKQKGINYLIEACAQLKKRGVSFSLKIIGDGDERNNLHAHVVMLGLEKEVQFLGSLPHTEIYNHLLQAELFVLPSIEEGFGVALLEAIACRVPVIGSDSGGITSIIKHRESGLLFPPRDSTALAAALVEIFNDAAFARRLVDNAHRALLTTFTVEPVTNQMNAVYHTVTASKGGLYETG